MIGYSLFRKTAALGTLNFYPAGVKSLEFDGITPVLVVGLAIQNTSNQKFTMNSLAGNVFCNNYFIGNVSNFTPMTIGANSQTTIYLRVRMSFIGIVNDIIRAFQTHSISQTIVFESYANVDTLQIPININYKIG